MNITVRIVGLNEIVQKLKGSVLYEPEIEEALDTVEKRVLRQGKGLGAQRNPLASSSAPLARTVTSTLNPPRTRGTAWTRKNESIFRAMAPNVIRKAVRRIEQRWAA